MSATLAYAFRYKMKFLREDGPGKEARLPVLICMILNKNQRNRVEEDLATIAEQTGIGRARVMEATQWLADRGAIYNVPMKHRVGSERVHGNQKVWQLTGMIWLDGGICVYLLMNKKSIESMIDELKNLGAEELVDLFSGTETVLNSPSEGGLGTENEPNLSTESEGKKTGKRTKKHDLGTDSGDLPFKDQDSLKTESSASDDAFDSAPGGAYDTPQIAEVFGDEDDETSIEEASPQSPNSAAPLSPKARKRDPIFDIITRRGFRLDPDKLPNATSANFGGRIGKVKKAMLAAYPDLTPEQVGGMYAALYKAMPNLTGLRDADKTMDYLHEYMQTGTIKPVLVEKSKQPANQVTGSDLRASGFDPNFRSKDNARRTYFRAEMDKLDFPPGFREHLEETYWKTATRDHINGQSILLRLQAWERAE